MSGNNRLSRECQRHPALEVSVVIPIFNKASFVSDCLESVRRQTFEKIEIICVDDCSTDFSSNVALEHARLDPRIVVARAPWNMGPGLARNLGLTLAGGRFVLFVDADDLLPLDAVEKLYNLAVDTGSELVRGSLSNRSADAQGIWVSEDQVVTDRRSFQLRDEPKLWLPYFFVCYLYSRKFLVSNSIRFPDLRTGEDPVFLTTCLVKASSISTSSHSTYIYRRDASAAASRCSLSHLDDFIAHVERVRDLFIQSSNYFCWQDSCSDFYLRDVLSLLKRASLADDERSIVFQKMQRIWPLSSEKIESLADA